MSWSSDSDGFWPRERMTVPNSLVVIWPAYQVNPSMPRLQPIEQKMDKTMPAKRYWSHLKGDGMKETVLTITVLVL